MGAAGALFREIRAVIDDELTHVYVLIEGVGDVPLGVQGWHYKVFPPSVALIDVIKGFATESPLMWPQKAPEQR